MLFELEKRSDPRALLHRRPPCHTSLWRIVGYENEPGQEYIRVYFFRSQMDSPEQKSHNLRCRIVGYCRLGRGSSTRLSIRACIYIYEASANPSRHDNISHLLHAHRPCCSFFYYCRRRLHHVNGVYGWWESGPSKPRLSGSYTILPNFRAFPFGWGMQF